VLFPNVPEASLPAMLAEPLFAKFKVNPGERRRQRRRGVAGIAGVVGAQGQTRVRAGAGGGRVSGLRVNPVKHPAPWEAPCACFKGLGRRPGSGPLAHPNGGADPTPPPPGNLERGLVSCTGSQFCGFALIETKNRAMAVVEALEAALDIPKTVRIHWTGCPNSCGQAQVQGAGTRSHSCHGRKAVGAGRGGGVCGATARMRAAEPRTPPPKITPKPHAQDPKPLTPRDPNLLWQTTPGPHPQNQPTNQLTNPLNQPHRSQTLPPQRSGTSV
jgi:hypothetical protein